MSRAPAQRAFILPLTDLDDWYSVWGYAAEMASLIPVKPSAQRIKQKYQSHELRHTVITFDCNADIDDKTLANNHGHYNAQFSKEKNARSLEIQQQRARKTSDEFMKNVLYTENRVG